MADPGRGPGGPPPLFLDQNEARRAEKIFLEAAPLSQSLDDRDPPLFSVYEVIRLACLRRVNKPRTRSPKTTAKLI